jgi:hypothetical protein
VPLRRTWTAPGSASGKTGDCSVIRLTPAVHLDFARIGGWQKGFQF